MDGLDPNQELEPLYLLISKTGCNQSNIQPHHRPTVSNINAYSNLKTATDSARNFATALRTGCHTHDANPQPPDSTVDVMVIITQPIGQGLTLQQCETIRSLQGSQGGRATTSDNGPAATSGLTSPADLFHVVVKTTAFPYHGMQDLDITVCVKWYMCKERGKLAAMQAASVHQVYGFARDATFKTVG